MMDFVILTASERTAAIALNRSGVAVQPAAITLGLLVGGYVVPAHLLADTDYLTNAPALVSYLSARTVSSLDPAAIFA